MLRVKKLDPSADIAWLLGKFPIPHPADHIETLGLEALHMHKDALLEKPEHFKGVYDKIRVWTVNDDAEKKTLADLGVAAIITDFPIGKQ
jgi:glycerophosphoryl diester phosphodiesterase